MRVLIAVHGYPPTHNGGAERRAERTARRLASFGHDVRVLCVEAISREAGQSHSEEHLQDGLPVRRLILAEADRPVTPRSGYLDPVTGGAVAAIIDEWQPDIFHLFSGYLMSASVVQAAAQRRVPIVISLTDYWWLCHRINLIQTNGARCDGPSAGGCARCEAEMQRRWRLPARLWPAGAHQLFQAGEAIPALGHLLALPQQRERARVLQATLQQVAAFIAPSRYLADQYRRYGVAPERLHIWRQGVELDACRMTRPADTLRVGYMGQIKPHKGVHLLLKAWQQLQGKHPRSLTLYGSDAGEAVYGRQIRALIDQLPQVSWQGQFSSTQVWEVLSQLDLLVVPSRWVENSPNSILEAQAVGVPIVGTNLGGIAELVTHDGNGLLFEVDNDADLARQLQRLLDEPGLLARLRRSPLPFLSVDDEVRQIEALYRQLASEQHRQPDQQQAMLAAGGSLAR